MKILMICLGNICRSPLAEGILRHLVVEKDLDWDVQSAGTSGFHEGDRPHSESIAVAKKHSIDISYQRSAKLTKKDIGTYDLLIVMDQQNYNNTLDLCTTPEDRSKVKMLLNYTYPEQNRAVPDPYYEGGFDRVYDMIYEACEALIETENQLNFPY